MNPLEKLHYLILYKFLATLTGALLYLLGICMLFMKWLFSTVTGYVVTAIPDSLKIYHAINVVSSSEDAFDALLLAVMPFAGLFIDMIRLRTEQDQLYTASDEF